MSTEAPSERTPALPSNVPSVTVADLLLRSYAQYASRPAVGTMTYNELGHRALAVSASLRRLGLHHGERVVLITSNCDEFIEIEHGLFLSGLVRVALSHRLHPREVAHIIRDCEASAVFADEGWVDALTEIRSDLPSVRNLISIGPLTSSVTDALSYADLMSSITELKRPLEQLSPDDLAALLYTSGTTGAPKGAALTHRNWVAMVRNSLVDLPDIDENDVVLHIAPLSHFSGYVATTCFVRGASHIVARRFDPTEALETIVSHNVTIIPMVPTMINALVLAAEQVGRPTTNLRCIVYGGSGIAPDRIARAIDAFGDVFVQFYGLSETPMPLSSLSRQSHRLDPRHEVPPERLGSAGRVNPFVEVRLISNGAEVHPGDVGEIVVRGDTVMQGYWGKPRETAEMIDNEGWAWTGDLGRFDAEGFLYVVDRKKDVIISGGYNVYPSEIENIIASLSAVEEVAVVGIPHERWGEAAAAVVVTRRGHELSRDEVVDACASNLARYKLPSQVDFVSELPKTGSGKVMRARIRAPYWEGRSRQIGG